MKLPFSHEKPPKSNSKIYSKSHKYQLVSITPNTIKHTKTCLIQASQFAREIQTLTNLGSAEETRHVGWNPRDIALASITNRVHLKDDRIRDQLRASGFHPGWFH